jgi:hypothetical protein
MAKREQSSAAWDSESAVAAAAPVKRRAVKPRIPAGTKWSQPSFRSITQGAPERLAISRAINHAPVLPKIPHTASGLKFSTSASQ